MKKVILLCTFIVVALTIQAQNVFLPNGNVGIGTISPEAKLDVEGDTYIGKTDARHYLKIS